MPDRTLPPPLSRLISWWRRIGGPSLTISIIVHALLLAAAGLLLVQVTTEKPAVDFLAGAQGRDRDADGNAPEAQIKKARRDAINKSHPIARIVVPGDPTRIPLPEQPPDFDLPAPANSLMFRSILGRKEASPMNCWPPLSDATRAGTPEGLTPFRVMTRDRCNLAERLQKLRENDGDERCERAVSSALEWLREKQSADGSWGRQHKGAMTGLALLCYLGRCYDAESVYGEIP